MQSDHGARGKELRRVEVASSMVVDGAGGMVTVDDTTRTGAVQRSVRSDDDARGERHFGHRAHPLHHLERNLIKK
eukprot:2188313-Pyramimonas_sp.AAC.1